MTDSCTTCRFCIETKHAEKRDPPFDALGELEYSLFSCRRFPPTKMSLGQDNWKRDKFKASFPDVQATDWCGEFQKVSDAK